MHGFTLWNTHKLYAPAASNAAVWTAQGMIKTLAFMGWG